MHRQHCVVIIGAGIAGLACAKHLIDNGIQDIAVLEATDRLGGRCRTIELQEHQIELGVDTLHGGPSNNPLYQLAEEHHLLDVDDSGSDRDDCYHDEDAESIDEDIVDEVRKIYDRILEKKVPTYPYENYPDLSLGEFVSAEFDQYLKLKQLTLDEDEVDERRKVIDWLSKHHPRLNTIGCNRLTDVSVQGWNSLEYLPTHKKQDDDKIFVCGGMSKLTEMVLTNEISKQKIELNTVVKCISIREDEQCVDIEIVRENQEVIIYRAEHVVCTQSVGCLKQTMHQMFVPPLPHAKRMSIQKLGFGTINKIYLVFAQPFWDVDFESFNFLWDSNSVRSKLKLNCLADTSFDSEWCRSMTGFSVHHRLSNVLMARISGEAAKYVETIPDDLFSAALQELLGRFYPENHIPLPEKLIRSRWYNDPFSRGSETFIKIGASIHDVKQLAMPWPMKPEKPLVLFAGEGTHERFYGTAHGAFMTGVREAKRIVEFYQNQTD